MSRRARAPVAACAALSMGFSVAAAASEPPDVLIEVRFRKTLSPAGAPPLPPWAEDADPESRFLPTRGIVLPEVGRGPDGTRFVDYRSLLIPASERQLGFLQGRHLCPLQGPGVDPPQGDIPSCVVRVHSNPRLIRDSRRSSTCPPPVGGGTVHGLRRDLEADAAAGLGDGSGVLIVVVDVALNAAHVKTWQGVELDPDYSFSNDGVRPGQGPVKSHGTMAAYLATVLAPRATLASISTSPFEHDRIHGAIAGLAHVVERFTSAAGGERYKGVVVNNSWAVADESYLRSTPFCAVGPATRDVVLLASPCHVFNRLLSDLAGDPLRFDFVFAAGNRGQCELADGQGSIRGPALHSDVTTVAAVDTTRRRLLDSGQGTQRDGKPDVSGYTHYTASGTIRVDTQTSAATAVVSGLVAAVRSCLGRGASPAEVRRIVTGAVNKNVRRASSTSTASPTALRTHDPEFGAGVVLPVEALRTACRPTALLGPERMNGIERGRAAGGEPPGQ